MPKTYSEKHLQNAYEQLSKAAIELDSLVAAPKWAQYLCAALSEMLLYIKNKEAGD